MPQPVRKYRRKFDGFIVEAYQYAEGKDWSPEALTKVAAFVTGIDINKNTTIETERIQDVVNPILTDWDMAGGKQPIEISQGTGTIRLDVGDWIVRGAHNKLEFVKKDAFDDQYEPLHEVRPGEYMSVMEVKVEELSNFIFNECMQDLEGDLYKHLAESIARKLIRAGVRMEGVSA
jgi:hypothetical protein